MMYLIYMFHGKQNGGKFEKGGLFMKNKAFAEALSVAIKGDLKDFKLKKKKDADGKDVVIVMFRGENTGENDLKTYASMCKNIEHLGSVLTKYAGRYQLKNRPNFMPDFVKFNKETRIVLDEFRKASKRWSMVSMKTHTILSYVLPIEYKPIRNFMNDVSAIRVVEERKWISGVEASEVITHIIDDYVKAVESDMKKTEVNTQ